MGGGEGARSEGEPNYPSKRNTRCRERTTTASWRKNLAVGGEGGVMKRTGPETKNTDGERNEYRCHQKKKGKWAWCGKRGGGETFKKKTSGLGLEEELRGKRRFRKGWGGRGGKRMGRLEQKEPE